MGLLDDAIREHLELKRKHGADPEDVARQEQEIVHRQFLREVEHGGFVRLRHQAEFDLAGIGLDAARIDAGVAAHVDLSPSHESSFGHSRLTALAPATRLTWPPLRITSSLSVEPIFRTRGLAAS